ncbi:helix-turn-helix domain-containing protein [Vallitalea okinawensis]|uniref:helix-turn-helix domain-containing protein n=1 Tax=Vallitalea okinawensis TaxID=2078660 RepID=UPI001478F133|nr:helix-turn-helix domain-containing protein [Vallitalea okinawensis]
MPIGKELNKRTVYDYELELITESLGGWMYIDNRRVDVHQGDILFRQPGQTTQGVMRYNSIWTCFQFAQLESSFTPDYLHTEKRKITERINHPIINQIREKNICGHFDKYFNIFMELFNHHINPQQGSEIYIKSLLLQLTYRLSLQSREDTLMEQQNSNKMCEVGEYIRNNLDKDLSLRTLSEYAMFSPTYFHQQFTQLIGSTPNQYVKQQRLIKAKELLIHTPKTIEDISITCGFKSSAYFCFTFKKELGITPSEFKKGYTKIY